MFIDVRSLTYGYPLSTESVLSNISFSIQSGEYVAILGANGSGKSTLIKCLNGLCTPSPGMVRITDDRGAVLDPGNGATLRALRQVVGTVLQRSDDQIVGSVVEEDVAFGPENLGFSPAEVQSRCTRALRWAGLEDSRTRSPQLLSGGEKQRLAIAGVLAMDPPALLFDEATSMIDPSGRRSFLDLLDDLVGQGKTVLTVTHDIEEAYRAPRCLVFSSGCLVFDGTPQELITKPELERWGFRLSDSLRTLRNLSARWGDFSVDSLEPAVMGRAIAHRIKEPLFSPPRKVTGLDFMVPHPKPGVVECVHLGHRYLRGTEFEAPGIQDVSCTIPGGSTVALIGATGSGKSTLLRHLNGILLPTEGRVTVLGFDTLDPATDLRALRLRSNLAVQQPETALFESFVADDVAYGPRNKGLRGAELVQTVRRSMEKLGLPYDQYRDKHVLSLSGGEKRRVALAGLLALEGPLVLLDEPTAELDGEGRERVFARIQDLKKKGVTVLVTTHSMDEAGRFDLVAVMKRGELVALGPPRVIFGPQWDPSWGLELPWVTAVANTLEQFPNLSAAPGFFKNEVPLNAEELEALLFGEKASVPSERRDEESPSTRTFAPTQSDGADAGPVVGLDGGFGGGDVSSGTGGPGRRKGKKGRGRQKTGIEFFKNVNLGQFLDRPSFLRDMGARKKLALGTILFILTILVPSLFISLSVLAFVLAVGLAAGRVRPPYLLRGFIPALPYVTFMILLQLLFPWPGDPSPFLLSFGPLHITVNAVHRSLLLLFKLLALMALLSLYTAVTPLGETIRGITKSLLPLSRFGLPVREFSLALGIALRFVPLLAEEAERITVAQLSRGGGYQGKGRIRAATAMTVPLFLRALERSESLATAMELRLFEIHSHPLNSGSPSSLPRRD